MGEGVEVHFEKGLQICIRIIIFINIQKLEFINV